MNPFLVVISIVIGTILFLLFIAFLAYLKIKNYFKSLGYSSKQVREMIRQGDYDSKYRHKSISGMSNILVPKIKKDLPDFNESEFYSKVETSLKGVFESLSSKNVSKIKELSLINNYLEEEIREMNESNTEINYSNVSFHKHAIKEYKKDGGVLTIVVGTSLEYNFSKKENGKETIKKKDYKTQSAMITEFVYIYDEDKFDKNQKTFGIHCPNCGAPIKSIKDKVCPYCSINYVDINLRNWFLSNYKEKK